MPSRPRSRSAAASSSGTSASGRRASGWRSAATPGRGSRSCAIAASAISSPTRTASSSPSRGRSYGVYAPILCPKSGVAALARDTESSKQVWSAIEGYPGDFQLSRLLPRRRLRPRLRLSQAAPAPDRHPQPPGIKYYKITGRTDTSSRTTRTPPWKRPPSTPATSCSTARSRSNGCAASMDRPPLIVAPYDAELFGHWWFEGPDWINFLLRKMHYDQQPSRRSPCRSISTGTRRSRSRQPTLSSWGYKGYCEVWLEGSNDWIYRHLHEDADRMVELAQQPRRARQRPAPPGPQPGRPRATAGAIERLGVYHEDRHDGGIRRAADQRACAQLQSSVRAAERNDVDEPWLTRSSGRTICSPI